ncbi:hypothetical protein LMG29542_08253 [Paraburkholderia humisilvae]|uniref:Uncharacterized protein n=1 Tax=Paraburkholderia humisilvae TaxID=627669 RepID=A0A6J5FAM8_9BURK|nr:hypothetical protein LMG29542_08253 [Paraburkholderia humisilvae]
MRFMMNATQVRGRLCVRWRLAITSATTNLMNGSIAWKVMSRHPCQNFNIDRNVVYGVDLVGACIGRS